MLPHSLDLGGPEEACPTKGGRREKTRLDLAASSPTRGGGLGRISIRQF